MSYTICCELQAMWSLWHLWWVCSLFPHMHHKQALYKEKNLKINSVSCSVVFEFNIMNKMVQNRSELWHPWTKRSHRRNRDCVTNTGPALWMALCEYFEEKKQTQEHHRNDTCHSTDDTSPKSKQCIYKLQSDCKKRERSLKWAVWTKTDCCAAWQEMN